KAIALGGHKGENLWYLATASPPARFVKALFPAVFGESAAQVAPRPRSTPAHPLFKPIEESLAEIPPGPPILIVGVDLEAEFDWAGPRSRTDNSVKNVREQVLVHKMFEKFGVRPTYLVDYAVATQADGYI